MLEAHFIEDTPAAEDTETWRQGEMALRAGLVASQRLWFTNVNGYGTACGKRSVKKTRGAEEFNDSMTNDLMTFLNQSLLYKRPLISIPNLTPR